MLKYIKLLIISLFAGLFSSVPLSSTLSLSFLNEVLHFSESSGEINLCLGIIYLSFSFVAAFYVRKIYAKGLKLVFSKSANKRSSSYKSYKNMLLGIAVSFVSSALLFIPVSKENKLLDVLVNYITDGNLLVGAFCSVASGIILFIAIWYCRQDGEAKKRSSKITDSLRLALYQLPFNIFPGFSSASSAAVSLSLGGVDDRFVVRESLIYLAPSMLSAGIIRIINACLHSVTLDPIMIGVCFVCALVGNIIMMSMVARINLRRSYLFFAILSIICGLFTAVAAFIVK